MFVANGATLTIDANGGFPVINGGELENDGTTNYTSTLNPLEFDNGADIYNTGLFDIQTDTTIKVGRPSSVSGATSESRTSVVPRASTAASPGTRSTPSVVALPSSSTSGR